MKYNLAAFVEIKSIVMMNIEAEGDTLEEAIKNADNGQLIEGEAFPQGQPTIVDISPSFSPGDEKVRSTVLSNFTSLTKKRNEKITPVN